MEPGRWRHKLRRIGGSGRGAVSVSVSCHVITHHVPQLAGGCVTTGRGTLPVRLRYSVSLVTNHTPDLGLVPATAAAACHPAPVLLRLSSTLCLGGGRRVGRVRCHCSVYRLSRPARRRHNVSFTHFVTTSHYTRFQIQHLVKGETVFNNMLHWCTFADYCSNFSLFIKIKLTNFHHRAAGCTTRPGGSLPNNYSPLVTGTINNKTHHKARMSLQHSTSLFSVPSL